MNEFPSPEIVYAPKEDKPLVKMTNKQKKRDKRKAQKKARKLQ